MGTKKQKTLKTRALTHVKHVVVPHKGNGFKPHLIRPIGVAASIILVLAIQFIYHGISTGHPAVLGRTANISVTELLADTNAARVQASLPPLTLSDKLDHGAFLKAQDMLAKDYWAHNAPDGTQPWAWFTQAGYDYNYAGENLAKNYPNADATIKAWLQSPQHRANLLGANYTNIGFAVVEGQLAGQDTTLVVAFYGSPVATADTAAAIRGATDKTTAAPLTGGIGNPLIYFGSALQSLSPAVLAGLTILMFGFAVGITAHTYRKKLPKAIQRSWRVHHGLYSAASFAAIAIVIILMSGGGQI